MDLPTKEEYQQWRGNPITKVLVQLLFDKREVLKEGIAQGEAGSLDYLHEVIGRTQALKDAIDCILHDFPVIEEEKIDA